MWYQFVLAIKNNDFFIVLILFLGFLGFLVFLERFLILQFSYNLNLKKFLNNLKKMIQAEELERAINLCKKTSNSSLPKIALKAIEMAETDPTKVEGTIEEETLDFLPNLEKRLSFFPMVSTLILLAGILGTLNSLWTTFVSLNVFDTAQKQVIVGQSIANSLSYTGLGLIFCMLLLIAHYIIKTMSFRLIQKLQYGVTVLNNLLVPKSTAYIPVSATAGATTQTSIDNTDVITSPIQEMSNTKEQEQNNIQEPTQPLTEVQNEVVNESQVEDIKDEEEII